MTSAMARQVQFHLGCAATFEELPLLTPFSDERPRARMVVEVPAGGRRVAQCASCCCSSAGVAAVTTAAVVTADALPSRAGPVMATHGRRTDDDDATATTSSSAHPSFVLATAPPTAPGRSNDSAAAAVGAAGAAAGTTTPRDRRPRRAAIRGQAKKDRVVPAMVRARAGPHHGLPAGLHRRGTLFFFFWRGHARPRVAARALATRRRLGARAPTRARRAANRDPVRRRANATGRRGVSPTTVRRAPPLPLLASAVCACVCVRGVGWRGAAGERR